MVTLRKYGRMAMVIIVRSNGRTFVIHQGSRMTEAERKTVMVYLDLCRDFWPREELSTWSKEVEAGNIPDFGANLVY